MNEKKISTSELIERMKATRMRPHKPKLVEKFNRIVESEEIKKREKVKRESPRKIARPPETEL